MATTPIASLAACSWCGLLAERGPVCDACGSPVAETSSRTTVLRLPEASRHNFRGAVPASMQPAKPAPAVSPRAAAARWLSLSQASAMSGVPERTLRAWVSSRMPEDAPVRVGDPRFLLIRTPGMRLPEGLWMVDGPTPQLVPATDLARASSRPPVEASAQPAHIAQVATVFPVAPVPRPHLPASIGPAAPVALPVAPVEPAAHDAAPPPPPPRPQPPVRAPVLAAPAQPPSQPGRRGSVLSDMYVAALLAEDALPETWGFEPTSEERKLFRRHKLLTTAGVVLGFAGVAELIDFLMSHLH